MLFKAPSFLPAFSLPIFYGYKLMIYSETAISNVAETGHLLSPPVSVVVKPKWSLKNHLRKKKGVSVPAGANGDSSTFYLDLVIQPGQAEAAAAAVAAAGAGAEDEAEIRSESDPGSNRSSVRLVEIHTSTHCRNMVKCLVLFISTEITLQLDSTMDKALEICR